MAIRSREMAPFRNPRGELFLYLGNRAVRHLDPDASFRPPIRPPSVVLTGGNALHNFVELFVSPARMPYPEENLRPMDYLKWYLNLGCEYRVMRPGVTAGSLIISHERPRLNPVERGKLHDRATELDADFYPRSDVDLTVELPDDLWDYVEYAGDDEIWEGLEASFPLGGNGGGHWISQRGAD